MPADGEPALSEAPAPTAAGSDAGEAGERRILVPAGPMFAFEVGELQHEPEHDRAEMSARHIEKLQRRSGKPDGRHPVHDPPDLLIEPGWDNMHSRWSKR